MGMIRVITPLDRPRGLAGIIIDHAVNALDLVDDARGLVRQSDAHTHRTSRGKDAPVRHTMLQCAVCVSLATLVAVEAEAKPNLTAETATAATRYVAPGEFEPQEYIWLSWRDEGFLGTAPPADVMVDVMKVITPYVKVRLMFSDEQPPYVSKRRVPRAEAEQIVRDKLKAKGIDLSRVELFFHPQPSGAIQDPGPFLPQDRKRRHGAGGLSIRRPSRPSRRGHGSRHRRQSWFADRTV